MEFDKITFDVLNQVLSHMARKYKRHPELRRQIEDASSAIANRDHAALKLAVDALIANSSSLRSTERAVIEACQTILDGSKVDTVGSKSVYRTSERAKDELNSRFASKGLLGTAVLASFVSGLLIVSGIYLENLTATARGIVLLPIAVIFIYAWVREYKMVRAIRKVRRTLREGK